MLLHACQTGNFWAVQAPLITLCWAVLCRAVSCCVVLSLCVAAPQVDPEELRRLKRVDAAAISQKQKLSEMDVLAVVQNDSTYLQVRAAGVRRG
jgi:hypothetical protein